jgi:hypothetical protein
MGVLFRCNGLARSCPYRLWKSFAYAQADESGEEEKNGMRKGNTPLRNIPFPYVESV